MPQPELQNSMRMGKVTRNSFRGVVAGHVVAEHVPEVSSCDRQTLVVALLSLQSTFLIALPFTKCLQFACPAATLFARYVTHLHGSEL